MPITKANFIKCKKCGHSAYEHSDDNGCIHISFKHDLQIVGNKCGCKVKYEKIVKQADKEKDS